MTPGVGGSVTWSPSSITTGWTASIQASAVVAVQAGASLRTGEKFGEIGLGASAPTVVGIGLTGYYVWDPIVRWSE